MKKILSMLIVIVFVALVPIQTLATDSVNRQINVFLMDDVTDLSKCVFSVQSGLSEIKTIDTPTMNKIKSLDASVEEKTVEIFENIGITYSVNNQSHIGIIEDFNNIKSVSSSTSYVKISENGTQTVMSKENCLKEVNKIKQDNTAARSTIISDGNYKTGEYMRLAIVYFYSGNGYFTLVGEFEWLTAPFNRWTDAFSLYSPQMNWENINTDSFAMYTQYNNRNDEIIDDWSYEDPEVESDGAFYEWNIPGLHLTKNKDAKLLCQIWATLRVQDYDDYTQSLTIYSRYAHKKISLNASFSISPDENGVDLGADILPAMQVDYYSHYFTWDYAVPARQAGEY